MLSKSTSTLPPLMTADYTDDYRCPLCCSSLEKVQKTLKCTSCKTAFPFQENQIPDFALSRNFYYADIPKSAMQPLLTQGKTIGWKAALASALDTLPLKMRRSIIQVLFNEGRAAWKFLLDIAPGKRVLDCGAGSGILSIALARSFQEVVSFDLTGEQLQLVKMRAAANGVNNISCVRGGDTPYLPFPENHFDAVMLNGVLEWLPESRQGNPRTIQLAFLKEVERILKPGGECIIGIENRYSYENFLGKTEGQSALAYSSLMPRKVANLYSLKKNGKPYRTYTYSLRGYKKLFKTAGLKPAKYFSPYPSFRRFSQMLSLSHHGKVNSRFFGGNPNSKRTRLMNSSQFLKLFTPSFFILANKQKSTESFLDRLLPKVSRELNERLSLQGGSWGIHSFLVASGNKVLLMIEYDGDGKESHAKKMVINIPMNPYANERLRENAAILDNLHNSGKIPAEMLKQIPRNVLSGEMDGEYYYVEEMLDGVPGEGLPIPRKDQKKLIRAAFDGLVALHQADCSNTTIDDQLFEEHFARPLREVASFFGSREEQQKIDGLIGKLQKMLVGKALPMVWRHGDFSLKNLLFDTDKMTLSGMIDWDLSEQHSLPLIDVLQLLIRTKMTGERTSFKKTLMKYLYPANFSGFEAELIEEYLATFNIDSALIKPISIIYWISRIQPHVGSFKDLDVVWVQDNFKEMLSYIDDFTNEPN